MNEKVIKRDEHGLNPRVNGVGIEEVQGRTGWAVFTGCDGEDAFFRAFFGTRDEARGYVDLCLKLDADHDMHLSDGDVCVVPAAIVDGQIIAAKHFDDREGAEAVIAAAGLDGVEAAFMRHELAR